MQNLNFKNTQLEKTHQTKSMRRETVIPRNTLYIVNQNPKVWIFKDFKRSVVHDRPLQILLSDKIFAVNNPLTYRHRSFSVIRAEPYRPIKNLVALTNLQMQIERRNFTAPLFSSTRKIQILSSILASNADTNIQRTRNRDRRRRREFLEKAAAQHRHQRPKLKKNRY